MKTETKRTPGPYRIGTYFKAGKPREELWIHSKGRTCPVCIIPSHNRREQAENDADLFAAAPELLEALKALLDCQSEKIMFEHSMDDCGGVDGCILCQARAAIAKAEGK
jgi:hypothetical protein